MTEPKTFSARVEKLKREVKPKRKRRYLVPPRRKEVEMTPKQWELLWRLRGRKPGEKR